MNSREFPSAQFVLPPLPELRSATVFGRQICYYDVGAGPPLMLVHGIGGDADDWAFCLDGLSRSHRVIALDLLGFGRSDKPLIDYSIAGFVEVLQRFLQILGVERTSLIGGSLGDWIAATFARQLPQMVEKLVLVDAAGCGEMRLRCRSTCEFLLAGTWPKSSSSCSMTRAGRLMINRPGLPATSRARQWIHYL
jgi:pimeloyl-ACP methyl ester carboxylesterase